MMCLCIYYTCWCCECALLFIRDCKFTLCFSVNALAFVIANFMVKLRKTEQEISQLEQIPTQAFQLEMLSPLPPLNSLIVTRLFKLLLLPVFYPWHSGVGYCTYKCTVSAAADLEGARRRQSPPVSALQPRLQPASLESWPGPVELLLQYWVGEPKRGCELKLWWLRYAWN